MSALTFAFIVTGIRQVENNLVEIIISSTAAANLRIPTVTLYVTAAAAAQFTIGRTVTATLNPV